MAATTNAYGFMEQFNYKKYRWEPMTYLGAYLYCE